MNDDRPPDPDVESALELSGRDAPETRAPLDEAHRLLASERRCAVLSYLRVRAGEQVDPDELVAAVAAGKRPGPGPSIHRAGVETDLHDVHLPKLADAGVVEFDPVQGTVTYDRAASIEAFLAHGDALQERYG